MDLAPMHNSFTYTFPPPYYAVDNGDRDFDLSSALGSVTDVSGYLHFPFCSMICRFCSLHRKLPAGSGEVDSYLRALRAEIAWYRQHDLRLGSLYLGGGTPTFHPVEDLENVVLDVRRAFEMGDGAEVCVECAPREDWGAPEWGQFIRRLVRGPIGLSRISVGIQTWNESILQDMHRPTSRTSIRAVLHAAEEVGMYYNVDFLLGYPTQSRGVSEEVEEIIEALESFYRNGFGMPSVSIYQLWDVDTVSISRSRRQDIRAGDMLEGKDRLQAWMYNHGYQPGTGTTYVRSNEYRHKWTVHRNTQFRHLGIGSGAYSFLPDALVIRSRDLNRYIDEFSGNGSPERLNTTYVLNMWQLETRRVIMGLRSGDWIPESGAPGSTTEELAGKVDSLVAAGLLERAGHRIRLHRDAFCLTNELASFLHPTSIPRRKEAGCD